MALFIIAFIFALAFYLALTAGSGNIIFWAFEELFFGIIAAFLVALLVKRTFLALEIRPSTKLFNPKRWLLLVVYAVGPFFFAMAKANLDVAYRVITRKIKPGIVKISPGLKTDFGITMLANSITLTPGTLSVEIDKERNLYVHWIFVRDDSPKPEEICSSFPQWVRRIVE